MSPASKKIDKIPIVIFTRFQELKILIILSLVQFAFLLDYMIIMPIGPQLMAHLSINYRDLSFLISAYTLSAAISGFISSFYIDKIERKKALMLFYFLFSIGPIISATSTDFYILLAGRLLSGACGGVLAVLVLTIIGDVMPSHKLGRATSFVIAANGLAAIAGIPGCIFLVDKFGWQSPFFILSIFSIVLIIIIGFVFPFITKKIEELTSGNNRMASIKAIFNNSEIAGSMFFMGLLTFAGGFTILPFLSSYMVHNFSFTIKEVSFLFFLGGLASFLAGPLAGTLSDKYGKQNVFLILNFLSVIPIILITVYPLDSKVFAVIATSLFFMFSTARHVSSMTLINSRFIKNSRGQYLGINNSIQLLAGTGATMFAGQVLYMEEGMLVNFDILGIIAICASFLGFFTAFNLEESQA